MSIGGLQPCSTTGSTIPLLLLRIRYLNSLLIVVAFLCGGDGEEVGGDPFGVDVEQFVDPFLFSGIEDQADVLGF